MQVAEAYAELFEEGRAFFEEIDEAADELASVLYENRRATEVSATRLLAALAQARALPPIPDPDAQRYFTAGLARLKEAVEILARTTDVAGGLRMIDESSEEFARVLEALEKAVD